MSTDRVEVLIGMYSYGAKAAADNAAKTPEDKRLHQIAEGKGHALWQLGHLAVSHDLFINQWLLGGESQIPQDYTPKFAPAQMGGGTPTSNPDDYPSWDEVVDNLKKTCDKTIELLGTISDEDLPNPPQGNMPDAAKGFFGTLGESLIGMGMHDQHHAGQLALINGLNG